MGSVELTTKELIESAEQILEPKRIKYSRLQPRDFEILRFILEQKFCSLDAIYFRFFHKLETLESKPPENFWTTRQRLAKLRRVALIKTEKVLSSGKAHFLITAFGRKILCDKLSDFVLIKPTKTIDFSLFEHDVRVTMVRTITEIKGKSEKWYSEKWLKATPVLIDGKFKYHFTKDLRPDAFLLNSRHEKIALELEMSRKSKSRIEAKIRLYDDLLEKNYHSGGAGQPAVEFQVLDKVWFVATKPMVVKFLQKMIETKSRHPMCYRVDSYDGIIPEVARGE